MFGPMVAVVGFFLPALGLWLVLVLHAAMTVATVYVLRRLARATAVPAAPQEADVRHPVV